MIALYVLCLLVALAVANLIGSLTREGKTWVIPKGKHYSHLSFFPLTLRKRSSGDYTSVNFRLDQSMMNDLPGTEDDADWNKLVGEGSLSKNSLSYLYNKKDAPHHFQSWRVGWSYIPETNEAMLAIYYYVQGQRHHQILASWPWNKDGRAFNLTVLYHEDETEFFLRDRGGVERWETRIQHPFLGWTYRLRPYFGGNQPAPRECRVFYEFT